MTFHDSAIQQLNGLTSPFALICRALERRLCFTATAADWLRWLAEAAGDRPIDDASEGFQLLHRALLQREESRTATHVFCPACYCHHEIFISHASITASCRCNDDPDCPDLHLEPRDIELWTLPVQRLARALCRALSLNWRFAGLKPMNTWQIGSWSTDAAPAILTMQPDSGRLAAAILDLTARFPGRGFILLSPTARSLDASCLELLGRAGSEFFALESMLMLTHNAILQCTRTPGELFARFNPAGPGRTGDGTARQLFAMVKSLDSDERMRKARPSTILRLYCVDELEPREIARRLKCARSLVYSRLELLRRRLGRNPSELRRYSTQFDAMESAITDSKASRRYRQGLID